MEIPGGTGSSSLVIKFLSVMDYPNGWTVGFSATSSTPPDSPLHCQGMFCRFWGWLDNRVCTDGWLFTVSWSGQSLGVRKQEMKAMNRPGILSKIVQSCALLYRRPWPLAADFFFFKIFFFCFVLCGPFWKSLLNFVTILLLFYVLLFGPEACGNLSYPTRDRTSISNPLHWKAKP